MASAALLYPALSTCSAVSWNSGKIVEAIAQEVLAKYFVILKLHISYFR
ncbi:hypothetical protein [Nostoc sp.]